MLLAGEQFDAFFEGFSMQAVNAFDSTPVGEFTLVDNSTALQVLSCSEEYNQASVSCFVYILNSVIKHRHASLTSCSTTELHVYVVH